MLTIKLIYYNERYGYIFLRISISSIDKTIKTYMYLFKNSK